MSLKTYYIDIFTGNYTGTPESFNFKSTVKSTQIPDISKYIGSGPSTIQIPIARDVENSGYLNDLSFLHKVEIYSSDDKTNVRTELVYIGLITGIKHAVGEQTSVTITVQGYQYLAAKTLFKRSANVITFSGTKKSSDWMKEIINSFRWQQAGHDVPLTTLPINVLDGTYTFGNGGATRAAQTFTMTAGGPYTVAGLRIGLTFLSGVGVSTRIDVSLYTYGGAGDPDLGTLIKTTQVLPNQVDTGIFALSDIIFDEPVTLTGGAQYAVVLNPIGSTAQNYVVTRSNASVLAGGNFWTRNAANWISQAAQDLRFSIDTLDPDFPVNYNGSVANGNATIEDSGDSITLAFKGKTIQQAIDTINELRPDGFFYMMRYNGSIHFRRIGQCVSKIETAESTAGVAIGGNITSIALWPESKEGLNSFRLSTTVAGSGVGTITKTITALDLSKYNNIGLWVRGYNVNMDLMANIRVTLQSTAGNNATWIATIIPGKAVAPLSWSFLSFNILETPFASTGTLNRASITQYTVTFETNFRWPASVDYFFDDLTAYNENKVHYLRYGEHLTGLESDANMDNVRTSIVHMNATPAFGVTIRHAGANADYATFGQINDLQSIETGNNFATSAELQSYYTNILKKEAWPDNAVTCQITNYPVTTIEPGDTIVLLNLPNIPKPNAFLSRADVNDIFPQVSTAQSVVVKGDSADLVLSRFLTDFRNSFTSTQDSIDELTNQNLNVGYQDGVSTTIVVN